jgi:hypothetical protein
MLNHQNMIMMKLFFLFFHIYQGTLTRQGLSDPLLQNKPWSHTSHPQKFPYMKLGKSLTFHQGCSPKGMLAPKRCFEPWTLKEANLQDQGLHHLGQPLGVMIMTKHLIQHPQNPLETVTAHYFSHINI